MKWVIFPLSLMILAACSPDYGELRPLDLHPYNIPMVILAPDSAEILEKDYKFMRDITIRKGPDFDLQFFELESSTGDAAGEKLHQITSVKEDPFFVALIKEEDYGFIYSKRLDSTRIDYDFRYIRLFGEKEIIVQTGLAGSYNLEQVKRMYRAVKQ